VSTRGGVGCVDDAYTVNVFESTDVDSDGGEGVTSWRILWLLSPSRDISQRSASKSEKIAHE
jgi:hypothetical protein